MRSTLMALALVAALAAPALAQDEAALKDQLEKKLAEPFLKKAPWITDWDAARAEAKKSGRPIFAYFTPSFFT